jgi:hypothetical protein
MDDSMSRMSDLQIEIQEYLERGYSPETVSSMLRVPQCWVEDTLDYMMESDEPDLTVLEEA